MTVKDIKSEMENLRFHRDTIDIMLKCAVEPEFKMSLKTELRLCLKQLKMLNDMLLDIHLEELKTAFPKADAVYEDKIIEVVGSEIFTHLHSRGKIQLCGNINGRRLYAL